MQAVVEQSHDKDGIIWPLAVAPYRVCITPLAVGPETAVMKTALEIYHKLQEAGVDVILDDRDERPGVKFKDSELVGFPIRIGVGEKSLAKGQVEFKLRGGQLQLMTAEEAVSLVLKADLIGGRAEVFWLDMGEPVRIGDLAERFVACATPAGRAPVGIDVIGLRPGEKMREELTT